MSQDNFIFWFVAIKHTDVSGYIIDMEKYLNEDDKYIIGKEVIKNVHKQTNGEHIHVASTMTVENYKKFHDAIHKKKMKLLLKASNGVGKQVGRVKDVRSQERSLRYCVKDKNIIYKNIDLKTIDKYILESFQKTDTWEEQIMNALKYEAHIPLDINFQNIDLIVNDMQIEIIKFYVENSKQKAVPSRAYMKKLILRFLMYEKTVEHRIINYLI